eukprot:PhF_6_TR25472/c0_g1_i2/m.35370
MDIEGIPRVQSRLVESSLRQTPSPRGKKYPLIPCVADPHHYNSSHQECAHHSPNTSPRRDHSVPPFPSNVIPEDHTKQEKKDTTSSVGSPRRSLRALSPPRVAPKVAWHILTNQTADVRCMVTTSDGETWCGDSDGNIIVRNIFSSSKLNVVSSCVDRTIVTSLAQVGAGKIWAGYADGFLRVYDTLTFAILAEVQRHVGAINTIVTWANTEWVFTGGVDWKVLQWSANSLPPKMVAPFNGHTLGVRCCIMLQPDVLVSGSDDSTIRVWKVHSAECATLQTQRNSPILCLIKDSNRKRFCSGSLDGTIHSWSCDTYECLQKVTLTLPSPVASILASESYFWVQCKDGLIHLIDSTSLEDKGVVTATILDGAREPSPEGSAKKSSRTIHAPHVLAAHSMQSIKG